MEEEATKGRLEQLKNVLPAKVRKHLVAAQERRDKTESLLVDFMELQQQLKTLKVAEVEGKKMKTMMDLGCGFFMKAQVPNLKYIFIDIGLGFYLEMTVDEGLKAVARRIAQTEAAFAQLSEEVERVRQDLFSINQSLAELESLQEKDPS